MTRAVSVSLAVLVALVVVGISLAASRGKMELKAGDEVYACACGEGCPCDSLSRNAGKCTCGNDMVKAKVLSVSPDKAVLKAQAWDKERSFKTTAKYACACPPSCPCDTQSQSPGKCTCGVEMKEVKM